MSLTADAFPPDEAKAIAAFIEDLDAGGGNLKLDPWILAEIAPKAMARIIAMHVPDAAGACAACGRRPCPMRQTALAYTSGRVADGSEPPVEALWPPPYGANGSRRTGWLRRPPAGGSAS